MMDFDDLLFLILTVFFYLLIAAIILALIYVILWGIYLMVCGEITCIEYDWWGWIDQICLLTETCWNEGITQ